MVKKIHVIQEVQLVLAYWLQRMKAFYILMMSHPFIVKGDFHTIYVCIG